MSDACTISIGVIVGVACLCCACKKRQEQGYCCFCINTKIPTDVQPRLVLIQPSVRFVNSVSNSLHVLPINLPEIQEESVEYVMHLPVYSETNNESNNKTSNDDVKSPDYELFEYPMLPGEEPYELPSYIPELSRS